MQGNNNEMSADLAINIEEFTVGESSGDEWVTTQTLLEIWKMCPLESPLKMEEATEMSTLKAFLTVKWEVTETLSTYIY